MRNVSREALIRMYKEDGDPVPEIVSKSPKGTEFVFGFSARYGGTVPLMRADDYDEGGPVEPVGGISIRPVLQKKKKKKT